MSAIILYYSRSGHTKEVADILRATIKCDIAPIKVDVMYPYDLKSLMKLIRYENEHGILPPLLTDPSIINSYSHIFLGTPIWYGRTAQPVRSFLNKADLRGKTIHPFASLGGIPESFLSDYLEPINRAQARCTHPLMVRWDEDRRIVSDDSIREWAKTEVNKYHVFP